MKINDSVCATCKYFWHECNVEDDNGDTYCAEYCNHNDISIVDNFCSEFEIKECKGYEK